MKVFDKIRDLFTEEVEEVKEEPVKKEVIQVEIPAPEVSQHTPEEPKVEEEEPVKNIKPQEEKMSYPVFFDEKDFEDIEKKEKKEIVPEPKKEVYKELYKESIKESYKDPYSYKKEEKKHFSPTPIISPVYGVLDKNYKKDDIVDKPKRNVSKDVDMTIDDVRNKAYGTLEDELESTLFGKTSILFATKEKTNDYSDLEEELDEVAETLDLLREDLVPKPKKEDKIEEIEQDIKEESDNVLDDLLYEDNEEYEVEDSITEDNLVEDALGKDFNSDDKLSESDLFNLIDDMYEKGDK